MRVWIGLLFVVPASAWADHDHMAAHAPEHSAFGAGASFVAATFSTSLYTGDYEGVIPAFEWSSRRFAAGASIGLYRIDANGRTVFGIGDVMLHAQASAVRFDHGELGGVVGVSLPTGEHVDGLGMGHLMAMPAAYASWHIGRAQVSGSFGFGRSIGDASSHAGHGMWPIVDPMNTSELTWSASLDYAVAETLRVGARTSGGIAVIEPGDDRVVAAGRVLWTQGAMETAGELQVGIAGDPFKLRAVLQTALHF